ncbi:MAG: permease [Candidatus Nealsonbacteria bacterium]|nr:permease [Candidatus Nealsonbacteria bacterium]
MAPSPTFDVLGFGALAVDDLLYVDEYPPPDGKQQVRRRLRQCGGLTGTALVAAARLEARCAYVGMLGDDDLSRFVADALRDEGIDLTHAARRSDARPGHSTIIVGRQRRTRNVFSCVEGPMGADPDRPDAELIRAARTILVDYHGLEGTIRAARIARESGVGVVGDFERDPGGNFSELLALVDHPIVPERFARELTGCEDPATAAEKLVRPGMEAVVVTCGDAGCWYLNAAGNRQPRHFPAFSVETVDTTGCGDVFHGAYTVALARGIDLHERIAFASATAALKAMQPGGQAGSPSLRVVRDFLDNRGCSP